MVKSLNAVRGTSSEGSFGFTVLSARRFASAVGSLSVCVFATSQYYFIETAERIEMVLITEAFFDLSYIVL